MARQLGPLTPPLSPKTLSMEDTHNAYTERASVSVEREYRIAQLQS
jgi:hypothetical protein